VKRTTQNTRYVAGLLVGSGMIYMIESHFRSTHGVWWGVLGGGVVFEFLYFLGSRFLNHRKQARFFSGFWGVATISGKLSWEIFYIWVGLRYLATPWGLGIGGLVSLAWFYYCLRGPLENR